jgi:hypothetical protein
MELSRRSFLKGSAAAGAAVAVSGGLAENVLASSPEMKPGAGNKWPGRVAINFNKNALSITGTSPDFIQTLNEDIIRKMVDDTIKLLTGISSIGDAWKSIFPNSLTIESKIAIKVNTLNDGPSAPHWASVKAITDGLVKMDFNGAPFPGANITIFEGPGNNLDAAGYNSTNFGTAIKISDDKTNLAAGGDGALNNRTYAKTLQEANFLINVFSPRGHMINTCSSTFTLGFKSHFGTYSSPMGLHGNGETSAAATNLRDINCVGPVYNKTVLSVCSAIYANWEGHGPTGGPDDYSKYANSIDPSISYLGEGSFRGPTTIMMSTDPVAIEVQTIKMMRINNSSTSTPFPKTKVATSGYKTADLPPYVRASGGVTGALSGTAYNIGQIDEAKMEIRRILNDIVIAERPQASGAKSGAAISASPIKGHNSTFIEFKLPHRSGHEAQLTIYDMKGALVFRHSQKASGALNHFSWDNKDASGKQVGFGNYIVGLTSGSVRLSARFVTTR